MPAEALCGRSRSLIKYKTIQRSTLKFLFSCLKSASVQGTLKQTSGSPTTVSLARVETKDNEHPSALGNFSTALKSCLHINCSHRRSSSSSSRITSTRAEKKFCGAPNLGVAYQIIFKLTALPHSFVSSPNLPLLTLFKVAEFIAVSKISEHVLFFCK